MTGDYFMGDHATMGYDLTTERLDPADDPKSIGEFVAESAEVTERRMRERQEDREERERLLAPQPKPVPTSPVLDFLRSGEERLVAWHRSGATVHPRDVMAALLEDARAAGFRDPPLAEDDVPDWKWTLERKRLTQEQVTAYAGLARKALHRAERTSPVDPMGNGDHSSPYPDPEPPESPPVAE